MTRPLVLALVMAAIMGAVGFVQYGLVPGLAGAVAAFVVVWGVGTLLMRRKAPPA